LKHWKKETLYLHGCLAGFIGYIWLAGWVIMEYLPIVHTYCQSDWCMTKVEYPWYWILSVVTLIIVGIWLLIVMDAFYPREDKKETKEQSP